MSCGLDHPDRPWPIKDRVRVKVPATTANLGPGFDALGMAMNLYNVVEMEISTSGYRVDVSGSGVESIPRDENNIVISVAKKVFEKAGFYLPGLRVQLDNQIPVSRGLGSSAAALVGGAVAANELTGNTLSDQTLLEIVTAIEGHPDNVAPALLGGVVSSCMVGDEVCSRKIPPPYGLRAVVAIPDFELSTKLARQALPAQVPFKDAVYNVSRAAMVLVGLIHNDWDLLSKVMDDRLHQPYREHLIPGMADVFKAAKDAGALAAVLSGAGPTLIAFAREETGEIESAMQKAFRQHGVDCRTMELKPCPMGAKVV